jgi:hypothetical protein
MIHFAPCLFSSFSVPQVSLEGLWGFVFCCSILLPVVYNLPGNDHGHLEDPFNSLDMIMRSDSIKMFFATYLASIFAYNSLSVLVTKELDSVWHSILDLWRPVTVWILSLAIHYGAEEVIEGASSYGEAWEWRGSSVQLVAMVTLLYGTAIYNGSAPIPATLLAGLVACGLVKPDALDSSGQLSPPPTRTPPRLASPALSRSPLLMRSIRQASEEEEHQHHAHHSQAMGGDGRAVGAAGGMFELPKAADGSSRMARHNSDV